MSGEKPMLNSRVALIAQEAKEMAAKNQTNHENHVAVCLDNQRRIETRFAGIDDKLDKQNDDAKVFREALQARLDAIRENDSRRYTAMVTLAITSLLGIIGTGCTVILQFATAHLH